MQRRYRTARRSSSWAVTLCLALAACHASPKPDRADIATAETPAARPAATGAARPGPAGRRAVGADPGGVGRGTPLKARPGHELAALAAGCFWGVEDAFRQIPGVVATAVGYTGGKTDEPTYEDVCSHTTGHAEAVLVEFDPNVLSYERLLRAFFQIHDPTTLDRQGPDVGDQYRSGIFTRSDEQVSAARRALAEAQKKSSAPVVTVVEPLGRFYKAEAYHQQYAERTGSHGCPTGKLSDL